MDICESVLLRKHRAGESPRRPLVPAEKNNALTTQRPRTREANSRQKSPSPSTPSGPRRCQSPNVTRTSPGSPQFLQKRALSAERKRPSTPPSPQSPVTPVRDTSVEINLSSRRTVGGRLPESLWPSTMRSLSVSFQSDTISIPVCKKEKPASTASSDRTLRPSSNVAHKQAETAATARKPTPERKRSPLKGKNVPDQSENSRPVDGRHARLIEQHRWPSRIGGKVSSSSWNRSVDLSDRTARGVSNPLPGTVLSSLRRTSSEALSKPLQKSPDESLGILSLDEGVALGSEVNSVDDKTKQLFGTHELVPFSLADRVTARPGSLGSLSIPMSGSRSQSPCKTSVTQSPVARGVSPSRLRPSTPPRVASPTRQRSSISSQSSNSTSVLSFIADFKKGKRGANYIEDAHQLRLLYNRYVQWRFANAQAEAILHIQRAAAERALYNVWNATLNLWDSVARKRVNLQQLKLELKLNSVLNNQMTYLNEWALLEAEHIGSLLGVVEDLEASTLRVPVTGGARADVESLKSAICSAVDVMQAMGFSICSLLPRVEEMNSLISELAGVSTQEQATLDKCKVLLTSVAAMQVEEYSHRIQLIQTKDAREKGCQSWRPDRTNSPELAAELTTLPINYFDGDK